MIKIICLVWVLVLILPSLTACIELENLIYTLEISNTGIRKHP